MELLEIDEIQATAILDMQLRRLAALERQRIIDELAEIEAEIADSRTSWPSRAAAEDRRDELAEIVEKYGDDRRTRIIPFDGEVSMEDLIAEEDVVVTITRTGYAKRTKTDLYRSQRRGGKGVQGAQLRRTTSSATSSSPRPTTGSCSSPTRAGSTGPRRTSCPRPTGSPAASTWPTCSPSSRTSRSPRSSRSATTRSRRTWCWPPSSGLVKKTKLTEFDSNRTGGIIAINLREDDELVAAALIAPRTTCCWSAARRRRSGSTPTTRRCGRWAGPPRA